MRALNVFTGYIRMVPLKLNFPIAPLGRPTRITFEDVDPMVDGKEASVIAIFAQTSKADITFPNATDVGMIDEVTLLQMLTQFTLKLSPGSPYAKCSPFGTDLVPGMDGYRYGFLQQFFSGETTVRISARDSFKMLNAAGAGVASLTGLDYNMKFQPHFESWGEHSAPPQFIGPYGSWKTNGGPDKTWSDNTIWEHWFVRDADNVEDGAMPLRWLLGKPAGDCTGGGSGVLQYTFGDSSTPHVDSLAWVWHDASPTINIWALVWVHPQTVHPVPSLATFQFYDVDSSNIRLQPGVTPYIAFMKQLDANGNMLTHSYATVKLQQDGNTIEWDQTTADLPTIGAPRRLIRKSWRPGATEAVVTGDRLGTRLLRNGVQMSANDGSLLACPGSFERGVGLQVTSSGETIHRVVAIHMAPTDARYRDSARDWAGVPRNTPVVTLTNNGKVIDGARGMALGARIQAPVATKSAP